MAPDGLIETECCFRNHCASVATAQQRRSGPHAMQLRDAIDSAWTMRDSFALTLILGFATLVSFVNQLAIARAFGAGPSMDLYLQAVAIPLFAMATFSGLFAFAM